jgi:hypothetical protein
LRDGQPIVAAVNVEHPGTFNIAGSGTLHAAVFGLVSVVNVRDTPDLRGAS